MPSIVCHGELAGTEVRVIVSAVMLVGRVIESAGRVIESGIERLYSKRRGAGRDC